MNLTKIKTPFGLLSKKKQAALKAHYDAGGDVETFRAAGYWDELLLPCWHHDMTYRAKPVMQTKPKVPWEVVSDEWTCVARDADGKIYLYDSEPEIIGLRWVICGQFTECRLLKVDPGTCGWKDSLVFRPGCEPEEST